MKVLVINCGSSSIKYKLYEMSNKSVLAAGGIEKIGLEGSLFHAANVPLSFGMPKKKTDECRNLSEIPRNQIIMI